MVPVVWGGGFPNAYVNNVGGNKCIIDIAENRKLVDDINSYVEVHGVHSRI